MSVRPHSSWKKKAFDRLVERDGQSCAMCGAGDRVSWRAAGINAADDWGLNECGQPLGNFTRVNASPYLEVDHKLPLRDGGSNDLDNLWLLCRPCHRSKTTAEHSARLKAMFAEARR